MKVFAVSLTAGVISTALVGCKIGENIGEKQDEMKTNEKKEISTKYDAYIDYDWSQDDKTYTIATNPKCYQSDTYAEFLTNADDDDLFHDTKEEVLNCMKCLETNVEGLSFKVGDTECDFTSGQKIEECKPFQALKDFVYNDLDGDAANLKKVVDAYHLDCNGQSSIPVFTGLEITENSDSDHPCDNFDKNLFPPTLQSDSTKENMQQVFSCMKCFAELSSQISYGDCDWTSSASIVYKMDCGAFQKIGDVLATTEFSDPADKDIANYKNDVAFTKCQTPVDTR